MLRALCESRAAVRQRPALALGMSLVLRSMPISVVLWQGVGQVRSNFLARQARAWLAITLGICESLSVVVLRLHSVLEARELAAPPLGAPLLLESIVVHGVVADGSLTRTAALLRRVLNSTAGGFSPNGSTRGQQGEGTHRDRTPHWALHWLQVDTLTLFETAGVARKAAAAT
eukprot:CAMPEP_0179125894 /NCGR_PEP_ID=MMETSP0796-20121207/59568_1 /TAXON_ID=73915 /ORGANISM="Pyrodinium bahamense, Strain pbaha01" /LENGTH=172 /DNA_ID=CAMNT_0020824625 /DNA_START=97 /DNA_END=615 /DNA_ORIENTATION=+